MTHPPGSIIFRTNKRLYGTETSHQLSFGENFILSNNQTALPIAPTPNAIRAIDSIAKPSVIPLGLTW